MSFDKRQILQNKFEKLNYQNVWHLLLKSIFCQFCPSTFGTPKDWCLNRVHTIKSIIPSYGVLFLLFSGINPIFIIVVEFQEIGGHNVVNFEEQELFRGT